FSQTTGLALERIQPQLEQARSRGLLQPQSQRLQASELGWRFLNDLIGIFANAP
ncbi:MAG: oxygen-independent coproporphyrinogen III oxidase-like protein, partial [Gammaproteobacteria bacterium]|nr:oxygen-independent coproporphyrinogen III oxidase-like protein [Gammaproteobacteria bacterium]